MALQTQIGDDGSVLTWDPDTGFSSASNGQYAIPINMPGANWSPQAANPNASTWEQVLQFGLARVIDAKTRPLSPQNTVPVQTTGLFTANPAMPGVLGINMGAIVIGMVIIGAFLLLKK